MTTKRYNKMDPLKHILHRSDTYVGSTRKRTIKTYISDSKKNFKITEKDIEFSPAILRIFIEALSNAIDNVARSAKTNTPCKEIKVSLNMSTGQTCIYNDGESIPVEFDKDENCYVHSLIFGQLLTSSNYNDNEDRYDISGRNGIGIKATSVFSKYFEVEGYDPKTKLKFNQIWRNNMMDVGDPTIQKLKSKTGYTQVSWIPDFPRFGIKKYSKDILNLYCKYVVDCAMLTQKYKVKVYFNDVLIQLKDISEYARLYFDQDEDLKYKLHVKDKSGDILLLPLSFSASKMRHISFVNGVYTKDGGTHVDSWTKTLLKPVHLKLSKIKDFTISFNDIKRYFMIFVNVTLSRPEFESQSKNCLQSQVTSSAKASDIKKILKWPIIEDIKKLKELSVLKKLERGKTKKFVKVDGFDPANNEGTKLSSECTLILVEGLSAKTFAVQGIQTGAFGKQGRDWFGIYPLRGKLLNVRNAKSAMISRNHVITDIIKILGVRTNVDYTNEDEYKTLRYGKVMMLCDADCDGIHITGLIQNMFHFLFPSLLNRKIPYLYSMQTPIVRVFLSKTKELVFYDENTYKQYEKDHPNLKNKYYKGLGSSSQKDIKQSFGKKIIKFTHDPKTDENMNKIFNKGFSDQRKQWLIEDMENKIIQWNTKRNISEIRNMNLSDYLNCELKKFSINDCGRSIPHVMDGLKESQRKVLYACFLKNLKFSGKTLKVAQLAGFVAEKTAYHHGEQNLYDTITRMANDYIGSNNIPYLYRDGQFGSRLNNGKDAASARYIFTKLDKCTKALFCPEDEPLLEHVFDDGEKVEPKYYVPVIPTLLLNGVTSGIGTGWSSNVPCYNPKDLIKCVKCWLSNKKIPDIHPWYKNFQGEIKQISETKYITYGKLEVHKKNVKRVTELPIGMWTDDFKSYLDGLLEKKFIRNVKNYSTPTKVDIHIVEDKYSIAPTLKNLKLFKYLHTSNMVLFTDDGIRKFKDTTEIIEYFCKKRYQLYILRKQKILKDLEKTIIILSNKMKFLQEIINDTFHLFVKQNGKKSSRSEQSIVDEFKQKGYDLKYGHDYMIRMTFKNITTQNVQALQNELQEKQDLYNQVKTTSEKQMWINDIKRFEKLLK